MTEEQKAPAELSTDELQKLVEQDKAKRLENCRSEIEMILQKHKCQLVALPRYTSDGRTVAEVQVAILP